MSSDPSTTQTAELLARATRAGYHLVRAAAPSRDWTLLDATDGEVVYSAPTLDEIERWLDA